MAATAQMTRRARSASRPWRRRAAALALVGWLRRGAAFGRALVYGGTLALSAARRRSPPTSSWSARRRDAGAAARPALDRRAISGSTRCRRSFVIVVNLGAAAASLYALGYGRHEREPGAGAAVLSRLPRRHEPRADRRRRLRVPGVVGVHVAGLLGAGDGASPRGRRTQRAGFVYIVMASFRRAGAAARLRPARRRRAAPTPSTAMRAATAGGRRRRRSPLALALIGAGLEGRPRAAARLAAARPSRRAEPRLGADERRDDQGRGLRLHPHRLRSRRPPDWRLERAGAGARRGDGAASASCTR